MFKKGASGFTYDTSKGSSLGKDMARNLLGAGKARQSDIKMPKFVDESLPEPRNSTGVKYHKGY